MKIIGIVIISMLCAICLAYYRRNRKRRRAREDQAMEDLKIYQREMALWEVAKNLKYKYVGTGTGGNPVVKKIDKRNGETVSYLMGYDVDNLLYGEEPVCSLVEDWFENDSVALATDRGDWKNEDDHILHMRYITK